MTEEYKICKNGGNKNGKRRFNEWIEVKAKMHDAALMPKIREGEIYWCGFGENVGIEINGKNELFSRPVLVFRKFSQYGFLGIPLTSKLHNGSWYVPFRFHGKEQRAVLVQQRTFSVSRLYGKMGRVDEVDMNRIRQGFHKLFCE